MSDYILVKTPEYEIRGEFLWFGVILHADVFVKFRREVKGRFTQSIKQIVRSLSLPVYAFQTPSHDPLKLKFIKATGGQYHHKRYTPDGELAEIFIYRALD
jgi:hypothetical protein